jgi:acetyl esterase/lipase
MIHGGGHIMFSRKDIRLKQTKLLLDNGLLPISIDYRLCPEVDLLQGPMVDVCDALRWAREQLPTLKLSCHGLQVDGTKVVVVGWSSGGHLAMTLAWTARLQDLKPPEAILAFYAPADYEDDCNYSPPFLVIVDIGVGIIICELADATFSFIKPGVNPTSPRTLHLQAYRTMYWTPCKKNP